jgi:hypothetical protein
MSKSSNAACDAGTGAGQNRSQGPAVPAPVKTLTVTDIDCGDPSSEMRVRP